MGNPDDEPMSGCGFWLPLRRVPFFSSHNLHPSLTPSKCTPLVSSALLGPPTSNSLVLSPPLPPQPQPVPMRPSFLCPMLRLNGRN